MPIFDQGYQHWQGKLRGHAWSGLTIARQGIRVQLRSRWTWVVLLLALVPALILAAFMILWGLLEQQSSLVMPFLAMLRLPPEVMQGPKGFRITMWTLAFQRFFNAQLFFAFLLVLMVGPGLISQDLRFNALPLYLSRPVRRIDYFLGKLGVIAFYLCAVAIAPALLAYLLGVCFSLDSSVLADTWRIALTSVLFGCIVVASAGMLMLALSSLSRNSRIVGLMWVGVWILTGILGENLGFLVKQDWCRACSYSFNLRRTSELMFGSDQEEKRFIGTFQRAQAAATQIPPGFASQLKIKDKRTKIDLLPNPPRQPRNPFADIPATPWYWPAGILTTILGLSLCILSFRVKSLDRLR